MRKLIVAAAVLAVAACGSEEKADRGIEVMPDMFHTPAYKSQTAGTMEIDARDAQGNPVRRTVQYPAMLTPPAGTVSRGIQPYPLAANDLVGARAQRNPLPATPAVLRQGQRDFLTYCAPCHGRDGDAANGYIAYAFGGIPSLNGLSILQMPEGEIFHVVTVGKGRMSNLRAQLQPERRWGVAGFLKVQARAVAADQDLGKTLPLLDAELAKNPADAALKVRRDELLRLAAQAKADLAAIQSGGDGHAYLPPPAPVPEGVGPSWPLPEGGK
jgi:mono/diheme cytochrome c family protein